MVIANSFNLCCLVSSIDLMISSQKCTLQQSSVNRRDQCCLVQQANVSCLVMSVLALFLTW